jgi:hypothetical protein
MLGIADCITYSTFATPHVKQAEDGLKRKKCSSSLRKNGTSIDSSTARRAAAPKTQSPLQGVVFRKDDLTRARSYHFVVAGWRTKKAESRARENDNCRINQFNEPLALPVVPPKWLLDRQSFEIRTGSTCG